VKPLTSLLEKEKKFI
jgi:hypothetical protein